MVSDQEMPGKTTTGGQRLDRWLWFARVLKSRTLAAQFIEGGKVRVNRMRVLKPGHSLRKGDVLTLTLRGRVQVLKVLAVGKRRGPAPEARLLYQPLGPDRSGPEANDYEGSEQPIVALRTDAQKPTRGAGGHA
jgi:ribosome-associated heat shock protein Hsp15